MPKGKVERESHLNQNISSFGFGSCKFFDFAGTLT